MSIVVSVCLFFFFNDTATTEIYTLSLHDALPISELETRDGHPEGPRAGIGGEKPGSGASPPRSQGPAGVYPHLRDRKSTRLNSSHSQISYAVFCLKKKKSAQ